MTAETLDASRLGAAPDGDRAGLPRHPHPAPPHLLGWPMTRIARLDGPLLGILAGLVLALALWGMAL